MIRREAELAEISFLASWTARYSALIHAQDYDVETFESELERSLDHIEAQM